MSLRALFDVPAPAKLNLFLHIVGRRADGYHLLESVFALIDWADTLHFERRNDGQLSRHDLGPTLPADDLCLRAARSLQAASGCPWGVDISINKQVPWGAGMGGGSSDAASTLLALNRLWALNWPRQRLAQLGLALGADVPFFVGGDNAFVQGVGERLTPLALPVAAYAVVKPPAGINTGELFAHPALRRDTDPISDAAILLGSLESGAMLGMGPKKGSRQPSSGPDWKNDLQDAAQACCPEVKAAAGWLYNRFGNSRMTGSGSAVFSRLDLIFEPSVESSVASSDVSPTVTFPAQDLPPGWVGRMCLGLQQHPLRDWAT